MLARVHTHSLSNGAGSISILALPDGHTNEDPGLNFVGSDVLTQATITNATSSPAYLTAEGAAVGPMARIVARGTRTASGTLSATVSVDFSVKDSTAVALGTPQFGNVYLAGPTARTVVINVVGQWEAQPSGAGFYGGDISGSLSFDTTTGVITYSGPTRAFLLTANLTYVLGGAASQFVKVVPAINSELVGTTALSVFSQGSTETIGLAHHLTSMRVATLSNGDTVRAVCANSGSTDDINFNLFTLTAQALSS